MPSAVVGPWPFALVENQLGNMIHNPTPPVFPGRPPVIVRIISIATTTALIITATVYVIAAAAAAIGATP